MVVLAGKADGAPRRGDGARGDRPRAPACEMLPQDHRLAGRRSARRRRLRPAADSAAPRTPCTRRRPATSPTSTPMGIARAAMRLGAGRDRVEDAIDPAVGVRLRVAVGDQVERRPAARRTALQRLRRGCSRRRPSPAGACTISADATAAAAHLRRSRLTRRVALHARRTEHGRAQDGDMPKGEPKERARGPRSTRRSSAPRVGDRRGRGAGRRNSAGLPRVQALVGLALVFTIAYLSSSARRAIDWRTVGWGLTLQFVFALIVLKTTVGQRVFETLGGAITKLLSSPTSARRSCSAPLGDRPSGRR